MIQKYKEVRDMKACDVFSCKEYGKTCNSCENTGCACNPTCEKCKFYIKNSGVCFGSGIKYRFEK